VQDEALLEAIADDPQAGVREVMTRYGKQLLGRLQRKAHELGQTKEDAEDIFQEALLRLLDPQRRREVVAAGGQVLPWLTRWGYWQLGDLAKKRSRELRRVSVASEERPASRALSDSQVVGVALGELSPRDQMILRWRYEDGLTNEEVATQLGISDRAAKKAAHDARERLRSCLEESGTTIREGS